MRSRQERTHLEKSDLEMKGIPLAVTFLHVQSVWPSLPHNSVGECSFDRGTYCTISCIYGTANCCKGEWALQLSPVHSAHCDAVSFWHLGKMRLLA